jgi:hypothetical protein
MSEQPEPEPILVDPQGRPLSARRREDQRCPQCFAGPDRRVKSCGFGPASTLCGQCGYDFHVVWQDAS